MCIVAYYKNRPIISPANELPAVVFHDIAKTKRSLVSVPGCDFTTSLHCGYCIIYTGSNQSHFFTITHQIPELPISIWPRCHLTVFAYQASLHSWRGERRTVLLVFYAVAVFLCSTTACSFFCSKCLTVEEAMTAQSLWKCLLLCRQ